MSRRTLGIIAVVVLLLVCVGAAFFALRGRDETTAPVEANGAALELETEPEPTSAHVLAAPNGETTQVGLCMNFNGEAAYQHGTTFYSCFAEEWLVCTATNGSAEFRGQSTGRTWNPTFLSSTALGDFPIGHGDTWCP